MTQKELAGELNNLREAFTIICGASRNPYVECSDTMDDQVFLFTKKAYAEAFVESRKDKNLPLNVQQLSVTVPKLPNGQMGKPVNGVRGFLAQLPSLNVDVVTYKNSDEDGVEVDISDILPPNIIKQFSGNMYNPLLNLTSLFFVQTARVPKEKVDVEELKTTEEEFTANLVKARLLLPVIPPEGEELPKDNKAQPLNLAKCRHPVIKLQNGESYLPVFSDFLEMQKYTGGRRLGILQVPFDQLSNFGIKDGAGFMLNPAGVALPLKKEQVLGLLKRFGIEPKTFTPAPAPSAEGNTN